MIRFTEPTDGQFMAGETHEFTAGIEDAYVMRGVAVYVTDEPKPVELKAKLVKPGQVKTKSLGEMSA